MSWIAWIILGLIAGFIGSKIVNRTGAGVLIDIVIGIVGALIGGYISTNFLGGPPVTGVNFTSLLIAVAGSIILLLIYNAVARRT
ncbi:GlsB/YeaQ/YmgE family stress response membrane protein [Labrys monachus]|uniref:Membrane protein YeaQ/YmgE (Transglycosylase-associated protein family) n=1 Tax=Labrys monachus TaxID=217067 RepID=A0ABU0FLH4_9HYPH|nr:GlsB/YeaQ/YmgE family stress response membrane protein [Labrys monachus]MDQ0395453.1 putative membrane protein YeaQ/YmgE (transglycosylase-associated protein family) [Labrys monachus]